MTSGAIFGLFGIGGFSREVMPIVKEHFSSNIPSNIGSAPPLFFGDTEANVEGINGVPVISEKDFFEFDCTQRFFNAAIGDPSLRERVVEKCIQQGAKPLSLQSMNTVMYDNNEIDEGAIICAYSMVTSNVKIGKYFHSNIYSYVAHDCIIGDYVTFAPNVHCNGNVHIQDRAYIGTGAVLKQGSVGEPLIIGEGAVIGMGAIVTKNVEPYSTVLGNPAKPFIKGLR